MRRLFLLGVMMAAGYAHAAYAANAGTTIAVSVTVVAPGSLTGKVTGQPADYTIDPAAARRSNGVPLVPGMLNTIPYERFSSTDSVSRRGGLFP